MRAIPDRWEIPYWLAGISVSFLIGIAMLRAAPGWSGPIFEIGTLLNVAMSIFLGGLLAFRDHWLALPVASVTGTVATVVWLDLLGFSVGTDTGFSNAAELVVGYIGMSVLVLLGAFFGCMSRSVADSEWCQRRRALR